MSQESHIETRVGAGGASSYIAGTRVRVSDIARLYEIAQTELIAERIVQSLPHLTVEQVYAAIEYWRENPTEIEEEIQHEEELLDSMD